MKKNILLFGILLIITPCFLTAKDDFSSNPQTFQKDNPVKKIYKKINDIDLGLTIYYPRSYEKRLPLPAIVFFEEQNENPDISPSPNALILFNPVVNTTEEGYGFERLGTKVEDMSPVHHVRSGLPPTIIFHGTIDTTVPYSNVVDFKNKMIDAGNRCELFSYEGEGHGFFNFNRKGGEYYNRTVYHADKFLISMDYLKGEPTIKPLMIE